MSAMTKGVALAIAILAGGDMIAGEYLATTPLPKFVADAEARIGRPLTPVSVAGVARRTTRRVVRRSTIYVAALPAGCVVAPIDGVNYWRCAGTYYASSGGQYVVVYVN